MKDVLHKDVHISERWNFIFERQPTSLVRHVPPFAKTGVFVSLASLTSLQRRQRCQRQTGHFPDVGTPRAANGPPSSSWSG
jgi:hypothetical protein